MGTKTILQKIEEEVFLEKIIKLKRDLSSPLDKIEMCLKQEAVKEQELR